MFRLATAVLFLALPLAAQQSPTPGPASPFTLNPLNVPTITPGQITLMELEGRFQQDVDQGGGKAFSTWFAEDAIALNNGKPATMGRASIAASAQWNPAEYQLRWTPQGAQMGPSNDMGFTWGHYTSSWKGADGKPVVTQGRYITVWKKVRDGSWKVTLDASADDVPNAGDCCTLPKP